MRPYQEVIKNNTSFRTFSEKVKEEELVWHRDREDRSIQALEDTDWQLQYDNELPFKLTTSQTFFIPKGFYHRVIKGNGDLKLKVIKHL